MRHCQPARPLCRCFGFSAEPLRPIVHAERWDLETGHPGKLARVVSLILGSTLLDEREFLVQRHLCDQSHGTGVRIICLHHSSNGDADRRCAYNGDQHHTETRHFGPVFNKETATNARCVAQCVAQREPASLGVSHIVILYYAGHSRSQVTFGGVSCTPFKVSSLPFVSLSEPRRC